MTARVQIAAKVCEDCGAGFERRRFPSGQLERASQFAKRRFCSRACFRKAAADRRRVRPVGEWITRPYALNGAASVSDESGTRLAVVGRYPWDRKQAPRPVPIPGPFPAERQTNFPETRQEAP